MRKSIPLMIAAAVIVGTPAAAQENTADPATVTTNDPAATGTGTDLTGNAADPMATAPMNGMVAEPVPPVADPFATDPAMAAPVEQEDDGGFPWGLLGLLGLLGLIPRKRNNDRTTTAR